MAKPFIICVDDERIVINSLKTELKKSFGNDYNVETAEGGEDAIALLKELVTDNHEVPLIITDYLMPEMKGDMLLKSVHEISPSTLKIMLTGQATIEGVSNAINWANLYRYIGKPWEKEDLKLTVSEAIKSYYTDRRLEEQNRELREFNLTLEKKVEDRTAEIVRQKEELKKMNEIITRKNKDITDSIICARCIQESILPHRSAIWDAFPQSFVLYRPKDIVSGDFYWFMKNSSSDLIAAADCTGHGVPGALTSMVCADKLNSAVQQSTDPGTILSLVNKNVKKTLKQYGAHETDGVSLINPVKDGMDIALCSVDLKNGIVKYAGAKRPLLVVRKGTNTYEEIKGNKESIGGDTPDDQVFDTHTVQLREGDSFYIYTDGFADQDGGGKGKKLMTRNFKQMLVDMQSKTLKEQNHYLTGFLTDWTKNTEQRDDILVIGIRI